MKDKTKDLKLRFLITGGAGFIGSALIKRILSNQNYSVLNYDNLTYAGNLESLLEVHTNKNYHFIKGDILDSQLFSNTLNEFKPNIVIHLAAESHVDRSIDDPSAFISTNIVGTYTILEAVRNFWMLLNVNEKESFRFHHVSTDEVYGSLGESGLFTENTAYDPSSPYSASKASSDHLVVSWNRTYDLPVLLSNCSNNYGPFQFPEKLIPLMVLNALEGKSLPIYGDGKNIRDWLFVDDHVDALLAVATLGKVGEIYNIGGNNEKTNYEVVKAICNLLDELQPNHPNGIDSYGQLISFVANRPGHDKRYAIDSSKIQKELGWSPANTFETGLKKTILWYLNNNDWYSNVLDGSYQKERLGLKNNIRNISGKKL